MKPLTQKDIPALASLIRQATHMRVLVSNTYLKIFRKGRLFTVVVFIDGKVWASKKIPGIPMKQEYVYHPINHAWCWEIVI